MGKLSWSKSYCYRYNHSNRFRNRNHKTVERGAVGVRPGSGRTPRLPRLPEGIGYDVCGFVKPTKFFVTHQHLDHLPAKRGLTLLCATPLLEVLETRTYKKAGGIEFEEYTDFFTTEHMFFNGEKFVTTKTYGYFIDDVAVVPESINAKTFLNEFRLKKLVIIFFKQPRSHMNGIWYPRDVKDCYFADPSSWKKYAPNIIPKCVPSVVDIKENPEVFIDNIFTRRHYKNP